LSQIFERLAAVLLDGADVIDEPVSMAIACLGQNAAGLRSGDKSSCNNRGRCAL
jgi:hypothetical protein